MIQLILTCLSAIAGGFLGAYFTRQTQHHKWLLERRAESFANFLQKLSEGRNKVIDIYRSAPDEISDDQSKQLVEACMPAMDYAQIVKFYLPKELRDEFYDNARKYVTALTDPGRTRESSAALTMAFRDRIQQIFEDALSRLEPQIDFKIKNHVLAYWKKLKARRS